MVEGAPTNPVVGGSITSSSWIKCQSVLEQHTQPRVAPGESDQLHDISPFVSVDRLHTITT